MTTGTLHTLDLIFGAESVTEVPSTVVLFGDDGFLFDQAKQILLHSILGTVDEDSPIRTFGGKDIEWRDLNDELSTGSLFSMGKPQPVIISEAATFITKNRTQLEDWTQHPGSASTLILLTDTWAANTKLYKLVDKHGLQISCGTPTVAKSKSKSPDTKRILQWMTTWAKTRHQIKLPSDVATFLLDISQSDFGMIDTSLAKLSLLLEKGATVTIQDIKSHVGGWKAESVWNAVDAALEGASADALACLHPIFHAGEHPLSVMGQLSWSLRRYAIAYDHYNAARRLGRGRADIMDSLKAAGFRPWQGEIDKAAARLRRLGRRRLDVIHRWLLDVDLALKGTHSREDLGRQLIERLMVSLAEAN